MLAKELWLLKNSISSVNLENKALSNVWWPTRWISPDERISIIMEKRLTLWLNSTLGIFSMLMSRQETRGPWIKFPKAWWEDCKVLDLTKLNKKQNDALDELWTRTHNKPVSPFLQLITIQ